MKQNNLRLSITFTGLIVGFVIILYAYTTWNEIKEKNKELARQQTIESVRQQINAAFNIDGLLWPETVSVGHQVYNIEYTINQELTEYVKVLLGHFRSDYSTIVVIDNETGAILSAVGHDRKSNQFNKTMPFSSTHPAASLIKIVATADLLERAQVSSDDYFRHQGRGTTLFRSQLENYQVGRRVSFSRAFAFSNNVVFGQAAILRSSGPNLFEMANRFGFNRSLMPKINLSESKISIATSDFNLAELASGFNRETMISPVHATLLSTIVANNGKMVRPHLVRRIESSTGEPLWEVELKEDLILNEQTVEQLQFMMEKTVDTGTARGHFRTMRHGLRPHLRIGGKTGTITGGVPYGRRDWFSAYAIPVDERFGAGISVVAMNINLERWYVRSTHLAKRVIEYYYGNVFPLTDDNL